MHRYILTIYHCVSCRPNKKASFPYNLHVYLGIQCPPGGGDVGAIALCFLKKLKCLDLLQFKEKRLVRIHSI